MPWSLAIPAISAGISALGSIGGGGAQGRIDEADIQQRQDALRLAFARLGLEAPGMRAGNSVRGDILANVQPVQISGPLTGTGGRMPQITGGLTPELLSGNTRQLGALQSQQALADQPSGITPPRATGAHGLGNRMRQAMLNAMTRGQGQEMQPTPLPQSGGMDSFFNILGGIGSGIGLGADAFQNFPRQAGPAPSPSPFPQPVPSRRPRGYPEPVR